MPDIPPFAAHRGRPTKERFERRMLRIAMLSAAVAATLTGLVGFVAVHPPTIVIAVCFAGYSLYAGLAREFGPPYSIRVALFAVAVTFVVILVASEGLALATAMILGMTAGPLTLVGTRRQVHVFIGAAVAASVVTFSLSLPVSEALAASAVLAVGGIGIATIYAALSDEFDARERERQTMFRGATVGIAWLGPGHCVLDGNDEFQRIVGRNELVDAPLHGLLDSLGATCDDLDLQSRVHGVDEHGRRFVVDLSHARVGNAPDDLCVVFLRDISDRAATEARSDAVLKALPDVVSVHRPDGTIEGGTSDGVVPRALLRTGVATGDGKISKEITATVTRALETGNVQRIELTSGGGSAARYVEGRFAPIAGDDRVVSVMRDVTTERATELTLRANEARLRALFHHSAVPTLLLTGGRVVDANEAARLSYERHLPPSTDGVVGVALEQFVHPDDMEDLDEAIETIPRSPAGYQRRLIRLRTFSNAPRWIDMSLAVVDDGSGADHIVVQGIDVTRAELARRRLNDLVREKDELIAGISHELRTPVTAIVGFLDLALSPTTTQAERDEMLLIAAGQAADLAGLIDDLLVGARADAGRLTVVAEPVDLGREVRAITRAIERAGGGPVGLDVDGTVCAIGDALRIRQVLRNLLSNAQKYGGPNLAIEVGTEGSAAFVRVCDDGPPIAHADRRRIFERYGRRRDDAAAPGSLGLGLWVSRLLAELMEGDLRYDHRDGRSVFELRLPVDAAQRETATPTASERPEHRNEEPADDPDNQCERRPDLREVGEPVPAGTEEHRVDLVAEWDHEAHPRRHGKRATIGTD